MLDLALMDLSEHAQGWKLETASAWRNQDLNFKEQLELGIRLFDIDSCYVTEDCNADAWEERGVFTCHGTSKWGYAYTGPISKILRQIDEWMGAHLDEVCPFDGSRGRELTIVG